MFIEEKKQIGTFCADLVKDGDVVFLDSGTTTLQIAKALKGRPITVLTNDLNIASELLDCHSITMFIVGGELNRENNNLLGSKAIGFFDDIRGAIFYSSPLKALMKTRDSQFLTLMKSQSNEE